MNAAQVDREEDRRVARLRVNAKKNRTYIRPSNADYAGSSKRFRRSGVKFGGTRILGIYDPAVAADMLIRQLRSQSEAEEHHRERVLSCRVLMKDGVWLVPPNQRPKIRIPNDPTPQSTQRGPDYRRHLVAARAAGKVVRA